MQDYTELDVGRCFIDFGVLENLYLDAAIVFLSCTHAYSNNYFRFRGFVEYFFVIMLRFLHPNNLS